MDGIITNRQLSPGDAPGAATLTVTGEDVSVMMDMRRSAPMHPAQPEPVIALKLIASYAQYGLMPMVIPPIALDVPIPIERIPVQQGTDLEYLNEMAERFGYVFYVIPGPAPIVEHRLLGPADRASASAARAVGQHGPGDQRRVDQLHIQRAGADDRRTTRCRTSSPTQPAGA